MNWRIIIGLTLLLLGVKVMYTVFAGTPAPGDNMLSAKIGSCIWITVGLYFLVKGMTKEEDKL